MQWSQRRGGRGGNAEREEGLMIRLRQGYDGQVVDFGFLNGRGWIDSIT